MILCCGEALIDFVPLPGKRAYQPCPGGSVFNIAVGLGRLDITVSFFCKMSTDFFSDMLLDHLVENNVDTSMCLRVPNPTTLAFVSLDNSEGTEPQFSFYANDSADRSLTISDLPSCIPDEVKVMHFGSISIVLEPGAIALEALMAREQGNRVISLDPNVRPNLIPDREVYRQRFENWLSSVDLLKLSLADREWIYPKLGLDECLKCWFDRGVSLVIQTRGGEGAEAFTSDGENAFVETPKVKVADTVGAGDTFIAATLAYLTEEDLLEKDHLSRLDGHQLSGVLSFASRAAAINCTRVGADPPFRYEI